MMKEDKYMGFELSPQQKEIWNLSSDGFHPCCQAIVKCDRSLNKDAIVNTVNTIMHRYEILRTDFVSSDVLAYPLQIIRDGSDFRDLKVYSYSDSKDSKQDVCDDFMELKEFISWHPERDQNLRIEILEIAGDKSYIKFIIPSLVVDYLSMQLLLVEFLSIYFGKEGQIVSKEEIIQYKDYAYWQNGIINDPDEEALEFLAGYDFKNHLGARKMVFEGNQIETNHFSYHQVMEKVDSDCVGGLQKLSSDLNVEMSTIFLSVLQILLKKHDPAFNDVIGLNLNKRDFEELKNSIGVINKVLPIYGVVNQEELFTDLCISNQALIDDVSDWSDYIILESEFRQREYVYPIVVEEGVTENAALYGEERCEIIGTSCHRENYKLKLAFQIVDGQGYIQFKYQTFLFEQTDIDIISKQYMRLLQAVGMSGSQAIQSLSIAVENPSHLFMPQRKELHYSSVISLFEQQSQAKPNACACIYQNKQKSYQQLQNEVNAYAAYFLEIGQIKRGDVIGVICERSDAAIACILGILKSGAAFLPIDPNYPQERIKYILQESGAKLVIASDILLKGISNDDQHRLVGLSECCHYSDVESVFPALSENDPAYVIYTSGSTGKPKGCCITHGNLFHYASWCCTQYNTHRAHGGFPLFTSMAFDLTITSIFVPLLSGKVLYIYDQALEIAEILRHAFQQNSEIDVIKLTPSHLSLISDEITGSNIHTLIVGGEPMRMRHVEICKRLNPQIRIFNEYGPTECTVGCICKEIGEETKITIGKPIANMMAYILGAHRSLCGIGEPGEIYMGGKGLSGGYINQPELTMEKFIRNPFVDGEYLYKTGDLARWLPNGDIEYIGRLDDQQKIRGYRIEPGEISHVLSEILEVREALVLVKNDNLIGYFTASRQLDTTVINESLKKYLPEYMLPISYIQLDAFPLTPHGKIDSDELLKMDLDQECNEYVAPRTFEEEVLVSIWSGLLKRDKVGIKDNFYGLGGDSIKSIQLVSRLKQKGYVLNVKEILSNPILKDLARCVKRNYREIDQSEVVGKVGLTPIQRSFFENVENDTRNYFNQSVCLKSQTAIDHEKLDSCIYYLVNHHDALRMVFQKQKLGWQQYNQDGSTKRYMLSFYDLRNYADPLREMEKRAQRLQAGITIEVGPLFRVGHFRLPDGDRLVLISHHLVIDGVSWRIIFEDLSRLYQQSVKEEPFTLPLKTNSFLSWYESLIGYAESDQVKKNRDYWNSIESLAFAELPIECPEGSNQEGDKHSVSFFLSKELTKQLTTQSHKAFNTNVNDILLTSLGMAIHDTFGMDKILLSMEGHGREDIGDIDVSRTVGWFTTVYPVLLDITYSHDLVRQLIEVKEMLHRVPNKGIDYGILRYISKERYVLNPKIMFNYLGSFDAALNNQGDGIFQFSRENHGRSVSHSMQSTIVLGVSAIMVEDQLSSSISYSRHQYSSATMYQLTTLYEKYLVDLIEKLTLQDKQLVTPVDLSYKGLTVEELQELNDLD